nr:hypothetical protein [Tanacetum cinerariifolium]
AQGSGVVGGSDVGRVGVMKMAGSWGIRAEFGRKSEQLNSVLNVG